MAYKATSDALVWILRILRLKMIKLFGIFISINVECLHFRYIVFLLFHMGNCFDETDKKVLEEIDINGIKVRRTAKLASGAFGRIWECQDISSGETYALKETNMVSKSSADTYNREVYLLVRSTIYRTRWRVWIYRGPSITKLRILLRFRIRKGRSDAFFWSWERPLCSTR